MATATLQYRVNSGALQTATYAAVAAGDAISLTAASFAGWATPAARWEVIYYPAGVSTPTGWTVDTANLRFYYLANSGASGVTPPDITLPATWGKWVFRLTVHDGTGTAIVSNDIVLEIVSDNGLHDLATGEKAQYGGARNWPKVEQTNLRTIDAFMTSGGAADLTAVPFLINGTDPSSALTAETNVAALSSRLDLVRHAAATNTVLPVLGLRRSTSGTAASGIGTGIEFEAEDNAGAYMVSAQMLFTASSVTPGQVTGPFAINTLNGSGSLVQRMALGSSGEVTFDGLGTGTAGIAHVSSAGALSTSKIVNADVDASAAIAGSKIDPDFGAQQTVTQDLQVTALTTGVLHSDASGVVSSSLVVNADVDASAAIAGTKIAPDFGSQDVTTTGAVIVTKAGIGTTKTRAITATNTTVPGSQVSPQTGWTAFHSGGTQHNVGWQIEPQTSSRVKACVYYGTGTGAPASGSGGVGIFYIDNSDNNFGEVVVAPCFAVGGSGSTGSGYRFMHSSNLGGLDLTGGNQDLRLKSYNDKSVIIQVDADSGGTGGVDRFTMTNIGTTTELRTAAAYDEANWGTTLQKAYIRRLYGTTTTTDATSTNVTGASFTPAASSGFAAFATVIAYEAATEDRRTWRLRIGGGRVSGGTTAVDGTLDSVDWTNDAVNTVAWRADIVASSPSVLPQVQGEAGKTIVWTCFVEISTYTI